jgi:hypothetical protein
MNQPTAPRPGGITLLMILGVINGIASIVAGILLVLDKDDAKLLELTNMSENQHTTAGVVAIAFGVLAILLALALGGGSNIVRWLFGIVAMFNAAYGVWGLFALHGEQQLSAGFQLVFSVIVLWILFGSQRSEEFFERS